MRLPIAYALGYPDALRRRLRAPRLRRDRSTLTFEPPDTAAFPCLSLAYEAGRLGGTAPAWLNAADEVRRRGVPRTAARHGAASRGSSSATLERYDGAPCTDVEALLSADTAARAVASGIIGAMAAAGAPVRPPSPSRSSRRRGRATPAAAQTRTETVAAARRARRRHGRGRSRCIAAPAAGRGSLVVCVGDRDHHAPRARPLRHREVVGHEGDRVLRRLRTEAVVDQARRDRVRRQGAPARGLREDPRDDLDRGARPLRRAAELRQPVDAPSACSSRRRARSSTSSSPSSSRSARCSSSAEPRRPPALPDATRSRAARRGATPGAARRACSRATSLVSIDGAPGDAASVDRHAIVGSTGDAPHLVVRAAATTVTIVATPRE